MTAVTNAAFVDAVDVVPVLELSSVRAGYGRIDVLHGIDLALLPGEVYALLGPNGAGKSTTLAVASGQIMPSSGSLFLCGREVTGAAVDGRPEPGVDLVDGKLLLIAHFGAEVYGRGVTKS